MQRAAIYTRVSTPHQADEGVSLETQRKDCDAYAQKHGLQVVASFREPAKSGALLEERPELQRMLAAAREHQFDVLITWKIDRLSRGEVEDFFWLNRELRLADVTWLSVHEELPKGRDGQFMFSVHGWKAGREKDDIAERMNRGRRERAEQGDVGVFGSTAWGLRQAYDETGRRTGVAWDTHIAALAREAFEMIEYQHMSMRGIATEFNRRGIPTPRGGKQWYKNTIWQIVTNPIYMGRSETWKHSGKGSERIIRPQGEWIVVEDAVPPVVSKALWEAVNRRIQGNKGDDTRNEKMPTLLRGRVFCSACGNRKVVALSGHAQRRRKVLEAQGVPDFAPQTNDYNWRCTAKSYRTEDPCKSENTSGYLEDEVREYLRDVLTNPERITQQLAQQEDPSEIAQLQAEIKQAEQVEQDLHGQLDKLIDLYVDSMISKAALDKKNEALKAQIDAAGERLHELRTRDARRAEAIAERDKIVGYVERVASNFENLDFDDMRKALEALVINVFVNGDEYEIWSSVGGQAGVISFRQSAR